MNRPTTRRAFSLLELIVAIALLGVLSASVYAFMWNLFAGETRALAMADRTQVASILFDRLERDLATAVAAGRSGPGLVGEARGLAVVHRGVPAAGSAPHGGDLQRTEIRFDPADGVLTIRRAPASGPEEREAGAENESPPALGAITGLRFRYHDGRSWRDSFESDAGLPAAVEVSVWFGAIGEAPTPGSPPPSAEFNPGASRLDGGFDEPAGLGLELEPAPAGPVSPPDRVRVIAIPDAAIAGGAGSEGAAGFFAGGEP